MSRSNLNAKIDGLLRQSRPDRFAVSGDPDLSPEEVADNAWLDDIAAKVDSDLDDDDARQTLLRDLVGRREGEACKRANRWFREYYRAPTLHPPGDRQWMGALVDDAIVVVTRRTEPGGQVKVLHEHVALRAATADDLRAFATEERRKAAADFSSRNDACAGAEDIADQMDADGHASFRAWFDQRTVTDGDEDPDV